MSKNQKPRYARHWKILNIWGPKSEKLEKQNQKNIKVKTKNLRYAYLETGKFIILNLIKT